MIPHLSEKINLFWKVLPFLIPFDRKQKNVGAVSDRPHPYIHFCTNGRSMIAPTITAVELLSGLRWTAVELLADLFAFLPRTKIEVATSVCTGGSNSPPDCCICGLQIWRSEQKKQPTRMGRLLFLELLSGLRYPKKSSGLRCSSIFSTAAHQCGCCICRRQRSPIGPNFHGLRQFKSA